MATYKGIKGVKVVTKATDPTASEAVGTVWYNSTSPSALKYSIQGAAAWAAGNNCNHARNGPGSAINATVPTALIFSGEGTPTLTVDTEQYDGTSWTEVNNMNTARQGPGGAGTNTAA